MHCLWSQLTLLDRTCAYYVRNSVDRRILGGSLTVTLINIVLMSIAVYYEMINEKEMRPFESDLSQKRGDESFHSRNQ